MVEVTNYTLIYVDTLMSSKEMEFVIGSSIYQNESTLGTNTTNVEFETTFNNSKLQN